MKPIFFVVLCLLAGFAFAEDTTSQISLDANCERIKAAGNDLVEAVSEVMKMESSTDNSIVATLQDALANILERINNRVNVHRRNADELIKRAKEIVARLKDLHADVGSRAKDLVSKWASGVSKLMHDLINKIMDSARSKRSLILTEEELLSEVIQLRKIYEDLLAKIQGRLESNATPEALKEKLTSVKKQLDEALARYLEGLLMPIKSFNITKRSVENDGNEIIDEIVEGESKSLFKKILEHLSGRYSEFVKFIREIYSSALSKIRTRHEKLVAIAKELIADSRKLHKETLREALEILKPYKEELGSLYNELVAAVKEALAKRD